MRHIIEISDDEDDYMEKVKVTTHAYEMYRAISEIKSLLYDKQRNIRKGYVEVSEETQKMLDDIDNEVKDILEHLTFIE